MNLLDFGADPTGERLCTDALQAALDRAGSGPDRQVRIPSGHFVSGGVRIPAGVEIHLEHGALLQASGNLGDYPVWPFVHPEFSPLRCLFFAQDAPDIRISGSGTIDLHDAPFMHWDRVKTDEAFPPLLAQNLTDAQRAETTVVAAERPGQGLFFDRCDGLTLEGFRLNRAPSWSVTVSRSRSVIARGLRLRHHRQAPNSDGLHFCGCDGVLVTECDIDSGDDCLAFTGITGPSFINQNLVVSHCVLRSSSSGIRLGHMDGKVRNVVISNCVITQANRGICMFAGPGGFVQGVRVVGCIVQTRMQLGHWWGRGEPFVICSHEGGVVRDVEISSVSARADNSIILRGERGSTSQITLRDLLLELFDSPNRRLLGNVLDLQPAALERVTRHPTQLPWLDVRGVEELDVREVRVVGEGLDLEPAIAEG